jgi:hypothetical protein
MNIDRCTRRVLLLLAALSALLSGCTTYVTTQVTAFSDWSGSDATRTYAFTRHEDQRNNLELSAYERIVASLPCIRSAKSPTTTRAISSNSRTASARTS